MRLEIKHSVRDGDKPGQIVHRATYYLREPRNEPLLPVELPERLAKLTLTELAKRWYLLNNTADVTDANAALLADQPKADATLELLLPRKGQKVFEFESDDPLLVAAVDERVRRALAMIVEDAIYAHYLIATQEQGFDLGSKEHVPTGAALPLVSQAIREQAIAKFES